MKKIICAVIAAAVVLTVPSVLAIFGFFSPPVYGDTYLAALQDKYDALKQADTGRRKIVIAGGSSVAFSVRSDLLEKVFPDSSVVNMGLYAALGTTVMLDMAMEWMNEGDVLIFAPEVSNQTLSTYFDAVLMWQACDGRSEILLSLPYEYSNSIIGALPDYVASKNSIVRSGEIPLPDGIYSRDSFNSQGDVIKDRPCNIMTHHFDPDMPVRFDISEVSEDFILKIRETAEKCRLKGIGFYFRICPVNSLSVIADRSDAFAFASSISELTGCRILGDARMSVMDPEWFYDTNFHLNSHGAVLYTAMLAADLNKEFGTEGKATIEIPDMPGFPSYTAETVSNGYEDCFIYEIIGDSYSVTGLTEKGKNMKILSIPSSYNGYTVSEFAPEVFAGNNAVEEITVGGGIKHIRDGSFIGCTALDKIILPFEDPERCSAGSGLLNGTDAKVYVPEGTASKYKTDYFWALYADRIYEYKSGTTVPVNVQETVRTADGDIVYDGNGGTLFRMSGDRIVLPSYNSHQTTNTARGTAYFRRTGFVLTGWNTEPDGSGTDVGLGSRIAYRNGMILYAVWEKAAPEDVFDYTENEAGVCINGCRSDSSELVIPEEICGLHVIGIADGAFENIHFSRLVLPSSLRTVSPGAFRNCVIDELVFFDGIENVSDSSFPGCTFGKIKINAVKLPVYSGTFYDTFSDKYDRLVSGEGMKKIVLASGSSGRYGYESEKIAEAFPDFYVVNMGVYAYSNALPQFDILFNHLEKGDILISAPEFDAVKEQFCVSDSLDYHFWAMTESNYDMLSELDFERYTDIFTSFGDFQNIRRGMQSRDYGVSPSRYDDDGNSYAFNTYNEYGDFILPRPNRESGEQQHLNTADYTVDSFPAEYIDRINWIYSMFTEKGVKVFFSYTPRNVNSLTPESTPDSRAELHAYLERELDVPVISDIEDYLLPGEFFWKIDSHTSSEGAGIRTAMLIKDLEAALNR